MTRTVVNKLPASDSSVPPGGDLTALLVERARAGFALGAAGVVLFAGADAWVHPQLLVPLLTIAAGQLLCLLLAIVTLGSATRPVAVRTILVTVACVLASGAVSDGLSANPLPTAATGVVGSLLAAALVPWGVRAQLALVAISAVTGMAALRLTGVQPGTLLHLLVPGALALSGSVYLAFTLERLRRARERVESDLALLRTIAIDVGEAASFDEALYAVVRRVCAATGAPLGQAWVPQADGAIGCGPAWLEDDEPLARFRALWSAARIAPGEGLPGRAWVQQVPVVVSDVGDAAFRRGPAARCAGLGAVLAVPVVARGETIAVLEVFLRERGAADARVAAVLSSVAAQLDTVLQRKRALDEVARSRDRAHEEAHVAATLLRANALLSARLGQADMCDAVTALAADAMGCQWSCTFVHDAPSGGLRLAASVGLSERVQHALSGAAHAWTRLAALHPEGDLVEIADAGRQTLVPSQALHAVEAAAALYVPIRLGGQTIGAQVHGHRARAGAFSMRQRRLAVGIGQATATALENARLIRDLEAASGLKTELVATLAHEIRTPVNVITGYAEMLLDGALGALAPAQRTLVERMRLGGCELLTLADATLDLRRIESGRETVAEEAVDVGALFAELADELGPVVTPGVAVRWDGAGGGVVVADRVKLKTIVKNLAGNALKFTTAGRVEVRATWLGGLLTVSVRDTGVGIAADQLPVIFEMFRQAKGTTPRRFAGVGLGLHIVKRLVDLVGGTVTATSEVGAGSTFVVTLPAPAVPLAVAG